MGTPARPVTLATIRSSMEVRRCQGCAHRAHPQGTALIVPGLHAIASIGRPLAFHEVHPVLPCPGKSLPNNFSGLARQDAHKDIKTILNRIEKQPGFIYDSCKWRDPGPPTLVINLHPQIRGKPICSKCDERRPGYDALRVRSFAFVPLWAYQSSSSMPQDGCSAQPVASRSKSCRGQRGKINSR